MAKEIKNPPTLTDIEKAIHLWLDLLSAEKYQEAYELTLHDPYFQWTPVLLEQVINGYGLPYENDGSPKCKVTKWSTASDDSSKHNKEINLFDQPKSTAEDDRLIIGEVYYDLPLDSKWSDLTATFRILQFKDFTTLELNEIHVM